MITQKELLHIKKVRQSFNFNPLLCGTAKEASYKAGGGGHRQREEEQLKAQNDSSRNACCNKGKCQYYKGGQYRTQNTYQQGIKRGTPASASCCSVTERQRAQQHSKIQNGYTEEDPREYRCYSYNPCYLQKGGNNAHYGTGYYPPKGATESAFAITHTHPFSPPIHSMQKSWDK